MEGTNIVDDRRKEIERVLDEYEQRIGIPAYTPEFSYSEEIQKLLSLNYESMERMHPDDCVQARVMLSSFAFHIQRSINREQARISWADSQLKKSVTPRLNQYKSGGSWEHTFDQATLDDGYTLKVFDIKYYAKQRSDRLYFLASAVREIGEALKDLERAKRQKGQIYG